MSAVGAIARKDWREFVRDWRLLVMAVLVLMLAVTAVITSYVRLAAYEADRIATERRDRVTWESQGERNPHSVAHFAGWALRPLTPLAVLEPGATAHAGSAVWMEAHARNGARARQVEDAAIAFDTGNFSAAWVLQVIVPLLLLVVAAGLVARERERGTLKLLVVAGAHPGALLGRKFMSLGRIALVLTLPVLLVSVVAALAAGAVEPARLILWIGVHVLYLVIVAAVAIAISAYARTVSAAMLALVCVWCLATLVAPRAGATLAQVVTPAPASEQFWADLREDMAQQPNPYTDEGFRSEVLARYGVVRVEDLPVSFAGLQLDQSEVHGHAVFDRHFGRLADTYAAQRVLARWASLVSPLPALQNVSTALAGTDTYHQLAFLEQAEAHRRQMVGALNRDLIEHGAGADFAYLAGPELWRETEEFRYQSPALGSAVRTVAPDLVALTLWALAASLLLAAASRRLSREIA